MWNERRRYYLYADGIQAISVAPDALFIAVHVIISGSAVDMSSDSGQN